MTARVPAGEQPVGGNVCSCGLNLHIWQNSWNHRAGCTMRPAEPTAEGPREVLGKWLYLNTAPRPRYLGDSGRAWLAGDALDAADVLLSGPLGPLLAEVTELRAKVARGQAADSIAVQRAYQRGYEAGRRAEGYGGDPS